jgi:hypothetical protein
MAHPVRSFHTRAKTNVIMIGRDQGTGVRSDVAFYPREARSRSARTQPNFYEALAPLGLPDSETERHRAERGGWSNCVLHAIGLGRGLGL